MPMKAVCEWIKGFRSSVHNGRHHSVVVDLPQNLGGEDLGPTALELAVMALAGCINTIMMLVAKKMKVEITSLRTEVEAEKGEQTIESCKVKVYAKSPAGKEAVEKVLKRTMEACPVGILFKNAGVKIDIELIYE